ncbi:SOS response-associated peptidase [Streptacidiphilus neutrinimicus]|uniref:SOS response-associated peptidase n=1 Tax=Streptacidiphilus neutrinimicus TaxID=105420 RepID=UPI0005A6763A|nr:SOS response-associated peptidase [Streptacidiphilus neutrinimicus]
MCGRYASSRKPEDLVELFEVKSWNAQEALVADYNVAPTKDVYAVLERPLRELGPDPVRQLRVLRWGLVPSWAKDPGVGVKMFNARAETIHEKPAYRRAFTTRRCLLPADGYFEWHTPEKEPGQKKAPKKQPYFVTPKDGSEMAFAGLYEFWRDRNIPEEDPAAWLTTCTVVTTAAEPELAAVHPRMPLVLPRDRWDDWLDRSRTDADELQALLAPPTPGLMELRPVGAAVGNFRNNGPGLLERVEPEEIEETLF